MPIAVPENPRLATATERQVFKALMEQLGDADVIISGQRVTDHQKDHEIDFVVALRGAGIICVEVKGGEVWHNGEQWLQRSRSG